MTVLNVANSGTSYHFLVKVNVSLYLLYLTSFLTNIILVLTFFQSLTQSHPSPKEGTEKEAK